jgi:hypothetical protein
MVIASDTDVAPRDSLIVDLGPPYGIRWKTGTLWGAWTELTSQPSEGMVAADVLGSDRERVFIDMGESGIRSYEQWWGGGLLHPLSPETMVAGDLDATGRDELIVDFGEPWGIWIARNYYFWEQLHGFSPPTPMVTADLDGNGEDDLIVDFGPPYGIYVWKNDAEWVPLHWYSPQTIMVVGDLDGNGQDDLVVDFGPPYGIYAWKNDSDWVQIHHLSPNLMVTGNINGY